MRKYPKIVQCDKRGQIVIPKDIRDELDIDESTGFWMFSISDEGILLKKITTPDLSKEEKLVSKLKEKSEKIGLKEKNIEKSVESYKKKGGRGNLEEL